MSIAGAILGFLGVGCFPVGWLGALLAVGALGAALTGSGSGAVGRRRSITLALLGLALALLGTALWGYPILRAAMNGHGP